MAGVVMVGMQHALNVAGAQENGPAKNAGPGSSVH
jgi:hypothetical protein